MKYRTKELDAIEERDEGRKEPADAPSEGPSRGNKRAKKEPREQQKIKQEEEMRALGKEEGEVKCMYTWKIKRDIFDGPTVFILNVSLLRLIPSYLSLGHRYGADS